jgi:hypothetical protein
MTERHETSEAEGEPVLDAKAETYALLEHAIRQELSNQRAYGTIDLPDEAIENITSATAIELWYCFELRWRPSYLRGNEPHIWREGAACFARCVECMAVSPDSPDEKSAAAWYARHWDARHAQPEEATDG